MAAGRRSRTTSPSCTPPARPKARSPGWGCTTQQRGVLFGAQEFGLHELAVEDAVKAHQRPKLERYGETLFLVLRPAHVMDETETVLFGEVAIFVGPQFVITVRHGEAPELGPVRRRLEGRPDLRRGVLAIVYAIVDHVVDGYQPVAGLQNDVDEIEDEVFGASPTVSRRIYELTREVIEFQRATGPLDGMLARLMEEPGLDDEERRYLRDVHDHALRVEEQADAFRALLQNILSVNLTLETKALSEASHAQNEQVKRISAWAAILFAPTLVGTIYGMNFTYMPVRLEVRVPVRGRADGAPQPVSTSSSSAATGSEAGPRRKLADAFDALSCFSSSRNERRGA